MTLARVLGVTPAVPILESGEIRGYSPMTLITSRFARSPSNSQ
jgi:hypothetical protein